MEILNIGTETHFQKSRVIKKIPLLSEQLIATTLFIDSGTKTPEHVHDLFDEIHYIIEGTGKIKVGVETTAIQKGTLLMVPSKKAHQIEATTEKMVVLVIRQINHGNESINDLQNQVSIIGGAK